MKRQLIEKVLKPIERAGGKAYFVGGCVRDSLMNKTPHDFDIVCDRTPAQLHNIFSKFSNVSTNSELFGVTMPLIEINGKLEEIEIATFRKDETKGRHPKVSLQATLEEDASRRDFTINAMYEDKEGNIIDPFNGQKDIQQKVLRFVGSPSDRLKEDPLRAFRFVRFLAKTGFTAAYSTSEIEEACKDLDFSEVSKERMLKEFKQILTGEFFNYKTEAFHFAYVSRIFEVTRLLEIFNQMNEVKQAWRWHSEGAIYEKNHVHFLVDKRDMVLSGCTPIEHGTVLMHTFLTLDAMHGIIFGKENIPELEMDFSDPELRARLILASILHDIGKCHCKQGTRTKTFTFEGKEITEEDIPVVSDHPKEGIQPAVEFMKNLKMTNEEISFVSSVVGQHMDAHELASRSRFHSILEFVHQPHFKEIMLVALADERGSVKMEGFDERGAVQDIMKEERVKKAMGMEIPEPILTGKDLIKNGRKPGPLFKKMLTTAHHIQIDQGITDKHLLYKMVKNIELKQDEI